MSVGAQEPRVSVLFRRTYVPKELPTHPSSRWKIIDEAIAARRNRKTRACTQTAIDEAADLEDDVWHLWIQDDIGTGQAGIDSAPGTSQSLSVRSSFAD